MADAEAIRLDIGCGDKPQDGYTGLDIKQGVKAHELPYDDGSVDEIRASHVLEHYSFRDAEAVVKHWHAKLKPGGIVRIAVPDFDRIVEIFRGPESAMHPIEGYIMGGHTDADDRHGAIYTFDKLATLLHHCGFAEVGRWHSTAEDCSSLPVSLNLQARKPEPVDALGKNIVGILSAPRIGFMENFGSIIDTLSLFRFPIMRGHGVFWGQTLTRLLKQACERGAKYALTIDYDSVFTPHDVINLYLAAERHEADILCPVQVKREATNALVYIERADGSVKKNLSAEEIAGDVVPIKSGHFGLTLIRTDLLRRMPKPWFMPTPDANGEWEDGRIDEDVSFWFKAHAMGARLFVCPRVKIGHEQRVISWPDDQWQARHQYMSEYAENGKPGFAR